MAFLKLYCVIFAWIYLVSYYCGFFACSLLLIIFRTILSLFSSPPQKTTDSHFSYFVCTQHCHDEFSKEGNNQNCVSCTNEWEVKMVELFLQRATLPTYKFSFFRLWRGWILKFKSPKWLNLYLFLFLSIPSIQKQKERWLQYLHIQ